MKSITNTFVDFECTYRVSAKGVVIRDNKVLLIKEMDDEWWSFPGGGIEHGETISEALSRELAEELAVLEDSIRTNGLVIYTTFSAITKDTPRLNLFCLATLPIDDIQLPGGMVESAWVDVDDITSLPLVELANPTRQDAAGLLKSLKLAMRKQAQNEPQS